MSKIFFTADYHFDHANIIRYANRPFMYYEDLNEDLDWLSDDIKYKRCQEMNMALINNHNNKVSDDDIVYHLGDFCFKHKGNAQYWENHLNGKIVHIRGNHDKNNGVKSIITHAIMEYGGIIIYATHRPPDEFQEGTIEEMLIQASDVILCGHVHGLWKHKMNRGKLMINVGVDVWGYEPVSIHSILKYIAKVRKGLI